MSGSTSTYLENEASQGTGKELAPDQTDKIVVHEQHYSTLQATPLEEHKQEPEQTITEPADQSLPYLKNLSVWAVVGITALITALIIGLPLGLGLGLGRHKSHCALPPPCPTCPAASTSPDLNNFTAPASKTIAALYNPYCPSQDNDPITPASSNSSYTINCGTRLNATDGLVNIISFLAYSLDDCTTACANINSYYGWPYCQGLSWGAKLESVLSVNGNRGSNCFLFNGTRPADDVDGWTSALLDT